MTLNLAHALRTGGVEQMRSGLGLLRPGTANCYCDCILDAVELQFNPQLNPTVQPIRCRYQSRICATTSSIVRLEESSW
jgi:hypothetical protein